MTQSTQENPANRLAQETSPYLLQHAHNPVDWYPWGEEAFAQARSEDKPIFLSVGYSACHWCHVMERESFENKALAEIMNSHFINIKVDREERPEIDQIYMNAVQALTGRGGWPMSVFLTPEGQPFFGGTYYPPEDRHGMPGFRRVLFSVDQAWKNRRKEIQDSAAELTSHLVDLGRIPKSDDTADLDFSLIESAATSLRRQFDPVNGGFGQAPKFPHPMDLRVLLRFASRKADAHALHMVRHTLDKMARGGIYDHLGGGFARYSTDAKWLVPHFEKMLYDNALLATTYTEAYQMTGESEFAHVVQETLDYLASQMQDPVSGGFYSTEDADSEGEEGKFYVWQKHEIEAILGQHDADRFCRIYDVSPHGNWEGQNILNLIKPLEQMATAEGLALEDLQSELAQQRAKLFEVRSKRIPPGRDTKILTSWNGLAMAAFAEAAWVFSRPEYLDAAVRCAQFIKSTVRQQDGRLRHSFKDSQARFEACLDDYANVIDGLVRVFEAGSDRQWLVLARELAEVMIADFWDESEKGFYYTGSHHETLIVRQKDFQDNATPSSNAMAATALARLGRLTADDKYTDYARATLQAMKPVLKRYPMAAGQALIALDFLISQGPEVVISTTLINDEFRRTRQVWASQFLPGRLTVANIAGQLDDMELCHNRPPQRGLATSYICSGQTCEPPVVGLNELEQRLSDPSRRLS
ncbi:MAG: hypothetical protein RJA81_2331 [Planctomycetota bacterium]